MLKRLLHPIHVGNKIRGAEGIYIGRPTPLGNPYTAKLHGLGQHVATVEESIWRYEEWLAKRIVMNDRMVCDALNDIYESALKKPTTLVCWCAPNPCHGDIIRKVIINRHEELK